MRRIIAIGDLHVGSSVGLLPPNFTDSQGLTVPQTPAQQYLWGCWVDFCTRATKRPVDAVVVNGDVIDGRQPAAGGAGLSLRYLPDQVSAAVETLRVLRSRTGSAPWYFTAGTTYHVGENGTYEEAVAERIGARPYHSIGVGRLVREVLWLDVDGVLLEFAHHIGGASGFYRLTPLDREMQWSALSGKDPSRGVPRADLIVRSHIHTFMAAEHASKQGLVLPCWQLQTSYARRRSVHRMHPDIGGVVVDVEPDRKRLGHAPCRVTKYLYDLPPVPITRLGGRRWTTRAGRRSSSR